MEASTSAMMIRDVPIDLRMQLKAIAAMKRRRLRDVVIDALREKSEKYRREGTNAITLLRTRGIDHVNAKGSRILAQAQEPFALREHAQGFTKAERFVGLYVPAIGHK